MNQINRIFKSGKLKITTLGKSIVMLLALVSVQHNAFAGSGDWKQAQSKDGQVALEYRVTKAALDDGEKGIVIEYKATSKARLTLVDSVAVMLDIANHKEFTGDKFTKEIKKISDTEILVYYYSNAPWPLSDMDSVTVMKYFEDSVKKEVIFTLTSAPNLYENKGVNRFSVYENVYVFKDLGNGEVEITVTAKMAPPMKVPKWMMKSAFPGIGFDHIEKLIEQIENRS